MKNLLTIAMVLIMALSLSNCRAHRTKRATKKTTKVLIVKPKNHKKHYR